MAKKKRPGGRGPNRKRRPKADGPPDRRALERTLRDLVGRTVDPDSPRGRAQALVDRAFETADPERRVELAHQALELWTDCADALVLLAENAPRRRDALDYFEQAVAAAERVLGPEVFEREAGHFWGLLETRPYMRAREGLAGTLWTQGRREEAVGHLRELLRLNPNDNQGVRYTLASHLVALGRDDDLARLLDQFPDEGSATWAYHRALLTFRREGDSATAQELLRRAKHANPHVPAYLLQRQELPEQKPAFYSPGDENEAQYYAGTNLSGWRDSPGALAWLRAHDEQILERRAQTPTPRGPLGLVKKWLRDKLPQEDDVWQAGARRLPNAIRIGDDVVRPSLLLVASHSHDLVLAHALPEEEPTAAWFWDALVQAMQSPLSGRPHRPTELHVRAAPVWDELRPHLDDVGIRLVPAEELHPLDAMIQVGGERAAGKARPGLLEVPGMRLEQVAGFYEAAAAFFRQAPWKEVGYESAFRVDCDKFRGGPWYAVLMGQSGLVSGLALYEDLAPIRRVWDNPERRERNARRSVATTLLSADEAELPLSELEAARRYGWPVARPDAYPLVVHKDRGLSHRPPLVWELELLEGVVRAAPDFVRRRRQDDPTPEVFRVPAAGGELRLTLSWAPEE